MFGSKRARVIAWIAVAVCASGAGAGAFYIWGGGFDPTPTADDDDDEDDDDTLAQDAAPGARPRTKKKKSGSRGKNGARSKSARKGGATGPSGMSYEAAIAGNNRQVGIGNKDAPDLTDVQLGGPMRNATFLGACGVPSSTRVTVKVAIRNGRAVGVSVYSTPASPEADSCVERRVRNLYWPSSAKMDSFVTTY